MKLNLGSGDFPLDGYTNVDVCEDAPADVHEDIRHLDFDVPIAEVRMSHVLEHISWRDTQATLERVRGWMQKGALLTVEVPDMEAVLARGAAGTWLIDVYGAQIHDGEYHRAGFTQQTLTAALADAGFQNVAVRRFHSTNPYRQGLPCLEATAVA